MPGTIEKMEQYNRTRDWENLIKESQFAKSSLAIIKVKKLYDLASQIQHVAAVKQDNAAIFMIQDMQRYYIQAQKLLYKELELLSIEKQVA
jgi:HPt (histidine-containing phosphotransfer) domain-containing protein